MCGIFNCTCATIAKVNWRASSQILYPAVVKSCPMSNPSISKIRPFSVSLRQSGPYHVMDMSSVGPRIGLPVIISTVSELNKCFSSKIFTRVEIPLKNRSRYERFERFFSKIWAVWAVWPFFFGKTAQTAQILLKKPLNSKTAHFLRWFLNGFSSKIWAVFERFLSGLIKKTN